MRHRFLTFTLAAAALAGMAGCSSFKMGAACYVPYGVQGSCSVLAAPNL